MSNTTTYCQAYEDTPLTEAMWAFARQHAWGWLRHWNHQAGSPLNEQDLEDLLSKTMLAILNFKLPEDAIEWEPCLVGYLRQVTYRLYRRARQRALREISLETFALDYPLPTPSNEWERLEGEDTLRAVASTLMRMPPITRWHSCST